MTEQVTITSGDRGDVRIDMVTREVVVVEKKNPASIKIAVRGGWVGAGVSGPVAVHWSPPSALASWMIPHNLGYNPVVQVVDSSGVLVFTKVTHLDNNTCLIEFSQPVSGTAELR